MGYKTLRKLLENFNVDDIDLQIKAIDLRYQHSGSKKESVYIKLYYFVQHFLFFLKFNKITNFYNAIIFSPSNVSSIGIDYIERNISGPQVIKNIDSNKILINNYCSIINFRMLKIWFIFLRLYIMAILDAEVSSGVLNRIIINIMNYISNKDKVKSVYFFGRFYNIDFYLSALLLSAYNGLEVNFITGSTGIYFNKRYSYLKSVRIICCSKVQLIEILNFERYNMFNYKELVNWGTITNQKYIQYNGYMYDIGIYSSGIWARIDGLLRGTDLDEIRNYKYAENKYNEAFERILKDLVDYGNKKSLRVKLYMHPFERNLYKEHNIKPPYWELLEKNNISIDCDEKDSVAKLYEVKVGVALFSTIIFERWENDLSGFIYYDNNWNNNALFNPEYLGKYSDYVFYDSEDLIRKLNNLLIQ